MANIFWNEGYELPPMDVNYGADTGDEMYGDTPLYGRGRSKELIIQREDGEYDTGFYDFCIKAWYCFELGDWVDNVERWCDYADRRDIR